MTAKASLAQAIENLRARNDALEAYLRGDTSAFARVVNAPETTIEDATERYRKYLDKLESRRSSVPPKAR